MRLRDQAFTPPTALSSLRTRVYFRSIVMTGRGHIKRVWFLSAFSVARKSEGGMMVTFSFSAHKVYLPF